ncbi:GDSL-type esterase/lipase family protein [Acidovorax sp. GBBC 3334]|uniref:GDSL-type esterase/lipase family protein n=1 Tax=unclassified Acidovorax TaxID=2684926 RepID=UPI0023022F47|nr:MULTISPECIES: GDSL-type esterase/lipase family protein [unclassified Acidovorax]MDA8455178.1 GDSL-type esterase/lipase family protein [Acidovorax sp. GBBC 3334]MDA8521281.1 GDSL-type esterase/lipase family protein [Acidovorax sp. NCPPB 4044]
MSIETFGDSILRGPGIAMPIPETMMSLRPGWAVEDRSAVGLLMQDLLLGYTEPYPGAPADAFPLGPQPPFNAVRRDAEIIVLGLGLNDALEMRSPADFEANLRDALRIIHSEWRTPILTGIVDVPVADLFTAERVQRRRELNSVTLAVAADLRVEHAGWGEDYRGVEDVIDNVHRTQAASDRLAALLVAAIERTF